MTANLTLAIPFYRRLDYLRVAIESVLAQDHGDWRLLVCDDGVIEPGARELIASFGDSRLRYLHNAENVGMVRNWNRCIEEADTPLVTLLHADDRLLPEYVSVMETLASEHPRAVAFHCAAQIIDAAGRPRFSLADAVKPFFAPRSPRSQVLRGENSLASLMAANFIMCPTLCYRRGVLGERRFDSRWQQVQDLDLTSRLLLEDEEIVGTREVAYQYRRHPGNATEQQSDSLLRFEEEFALFDKVAARADARGWHSAAGAARHKRIVKFHLAYRVIGDLLQLRIGAATAKLRFLTSKRATERA
jgi:glycosyltransferase involved in cell wall biosynthesis